MSKPRREPLRIRDIVMQLREKAHTIYRMNGIEAIQIKGHDRSWLQGKPVGGA